MKIAVTGATGIAGRFIVAGLAGAGVRVEPLPGWRLGQPAPLAGCDALVHAAFAHVPGKYRGGEGDDPAGFLAANRDGTLALFDDARRQGVSRIVFLSSRAVYDGYPQGTPLPDGTRARGDNLYARVKIAAEEALAQTPGLTGASLRATGIYGITPGSAGLEAGAAMPRDLPPGRRLERSGPAPGQNTLSPCLQSDAQPADTQKGQSADAPGHGMPAHKWAGLFSDYLAGRPVAPRRATELHGADLAAAVQVILRSGETGAFNASDLLLDRHDLLAEVQRLTGCPHALPPRDTAPVSVMGCARLTGLGWRPGGLARFRAEMPAMLAAVTGAACFG